MRTDSTIASVIHHSAIFLLLTVALLSTVIVSTHDRGQATETASCVTCVVSPLPSI